MDQTEVGYVIENRDFLIYLDGLPSVKVNDMVQSDNGVKGIISALLQDKVEVLVVNEGEVFPGQLFKRVENKLAVNVGEFLLGRAINPLGIPIDGKSLMIGKGTGTLMDLEQSAPGIQTRQFITEQFTTGITLVDTLVPLGKGQRELVIGDAHSGKTGFLIDIIVNQKASNTICVYASIGKPSISVRTLIDTLKTNKALDYTVIIAASSSEPLPEIFLTPQTAFTVAEYFQKQGKDVLLILDDMANHAKIYREISLLSGKAPGREGYPGDIFYQHSHLLERAGKFKPEFGGGSITALPVVELNLSDMSGYIPTNLMSMTDGHFLFKSSLHNLGRYPAIDLGLSVSRVGRQTQMEIQNLISAKVRQILAQAENLETISRFSSMLPYETQLTLSQRAMIVELITQESLSSIQIPSQIIMLSLPFTTFLMEKDANFLRKYKKVLMDAFLNDFDLSSITSSVAKFKTEETLIEALEKVKSRLLAICQ